MAIDTRLIKTTEKTYYEKFGELPPALKRENGFLMGEPVRHRTCEITKQYKPVYEGYIFFKDKYFVTSEPVSIEEFKVALQPWITAVKALCHQRMGEIEMVISCLAGILWTLSRNGHIINQSRQDREWMEKIIQNSRILLEKMDKDRRW